MSTASPPRKDRSCALGAPRRLARRSSCALALAILLAAPAALAAGAHGARCGAARGRRSHACAQSRRTQASPGRRAHRHSKTARPHRHARPGSRARTLRALPICEDGGSAVNAAGGPLRCGEGSEPGCEPPSAPTLSSAGTLRFCTAPATGSHFGEASCEPGQECVDAEDLPEASCDEGESTGEEGECADAPPPSTS